MKKPLPKSNNSIFSLTEKINTAQDMNKVYLEKYGDKHILDIDLDKIKINEQVRKEFDEESIDRLANSIKENDLLNPIVVKSLDNGLYELISGENRVRAFYKLKRESIPSRVRNDVDSEEKKILIQLTENLERKNLSPIETAEAFFKIKEKLKLTLAQLSEKTRTPIDTLKFYSRINNLTSKEKLSLSRKNMIFSEIQKYINNKKSVVATLSPSKIAQMPLFKSSKNKIWMPKVTIDFKKDNKSILEQKIIACEKFIEEAKKRISTH